MGEKWPVKFGRTMRLPLHCRVFFNMPQSCHMGQRALRVLPLRREAGCELLCEQYVSNSETQFCGNNSSLIRCNRIRVNTIQGPTWPTKPNVRKALKTRWKTGCSPLHTLLMLCTGTEWLHSQFFKKVHHAVLILDRTASSLAPDHQIQTVTEHSACHPVLRIHNTQYTSSNHTLRKEAGAIEKTALDWNPQGYRRRGRPKRTWRRTREDKIRGTRRSWNEVKGIAGDRVNWKLFMDALCSTTSERTWWWWWWLTLNKTLSL
jgi:hypothetical protein